MKLIELFEAVQPRVSRGDKAQQNVDAYLQDYFGDRYKSRAIAEKFKKHGDIVATLDGEEIQIEVKRRKNVTSPIKMYEKMIGRDQPDQTLDAVARSYGYVDFTDMVEGLRQENPRIGFPGDKGTPKSGSIYVSITERPVLSKIRQYILKSLREGGDHYFAIYNADDKSTSIFHTGLGSNPMGAPRLPNIRQIVLDTYGGGYKNKMRAGLKITFNR